MRVIISPHADDETIALGGSIAKWRAQVEDVHVIFVAIDNTICGGKEVLAATRGAEVVSASKELGCFESSFLYYLRGYEDNLDVMRKSEVVRDLEEELSRLEKEDSLIEELYIPSRNSHQDHTYMREVGDIFMRMSNFKRYDIYEYYMPCDMNFSDGVFINITGYEKRKWAALECYKSQMRDSGYLSVDNIISINAAFGQSVLGYPGCSVEKVKLLRGLR